jgi:hypothetical protein
MGRRPRTARPGDVCVLLEPGEEEIPALRQRQAALQARFGGRPHARVHLTCQRFELPECVSPAELIQRLTERLAGMPPPPVVATSLVPFESPFWGSRLLRWQIAPTAPLRRLQALLEEALASMDIALHYPSGANWTPSLVTALEGIGASDQESPLEMPAFPHLLFTARHVTLSRIVARGRFEILARLDL